MTVSARRFRFLLALLLPAAVGLVLGCSGSGTTPAADGGPAGDGGAQMDGGRTDGGASDGGTRTDGGSTTVPTCPRGTDTLSGTYKETDIASADDGGVQVNDVDLRTSEVAALQRVDGGAYCVARGNGRTTGTFEVPNITLAGNTTYAQVDQELALTSSNTIDFSYALLGRYDVDEASDATPLVFNVTGLNAWQEDDTLELVSAGAGVILLAPETGESAMNAPAVGATALAGFSFDYYEELESPWLINGQSGDVATLSQLVTQPAGTGTESYAVLARIFTPASFTMMDAATTTLSGAFTAVTRNQTLNVRWRRSLFDAMRAATHPDASEGDHGFLLQTLPLAATHGAYSEGATLIAYGPTTGNSDVSLGNVSYGNPYPANWGVFGSVFVSFGVDYVVGNAEPYTEVASVFVDALPSAFAAGSIEPGVSPVRAPKWNGQDAFTTGSGVGLRPTLTWDAPERGTPTSYVVTVSELSEVDGFTEAEAVGSITTTQRTVVLPQGWLRAAGTYYASITALVTPGVDPTRTPNRSGIPQSGATALTTQFTP